MKPRRNWSNSIAMVTLLAATTASVGCATAYAGDRHRNAAERAQDRHEIRTDKKNQADDLHDLARLNNLADQYAVATKSSDTSAIKKIDNQVHAMLVAEVGEAKSEVAKAQAEVNRSRREKRSDKREIRENRRENAGPLERADDRHDLRDDRRDMRDDQRDRDREVAQREKLENIRNRWIALKGKTDPASVAAKTSMLNQLQGMAKAELKQNAQELQEDKQELREDRRETREDRRQRG